MPKKQTKISYGKELDYTLVEARITRISGTIDLLSDVLDEDFLGSLRGTGTRSKVNQ